jgi:hypothetical protein
MAVALDLQFVTQLGVVDELNHALCVGFTT